MLTAALVHVCDTGLAAEPRGDIALAQARMPASP